ncbi:hypothetical protein BH20CHL6_BH20CHL6_08280 [soil metagenome]
MLAFGSDWPVVPFDPFIALHSGVSRTTSDGRPTDGSVPHERLPLPDALRAYTWGSAYAGGAEGWRGCLEPGALADLIVVDRDLLAEGRAPSWAPEPC